MFLVVFFFNDTATTEIYTLSLHDALPISGFLPITVACKGLKSLRVSSSPRISRSSLLSFSSSCTCASRRSEEHTSELQSRQYLVCRLLLEKKKNQPVRHIRHQLLKTHALL